MQDRALKDRLYNFLGIYIIIDCLLKWLAMYVSFRNGVVAAVILLVFYIYLLMNRNFKLKIDIDDSLLFLYIAYNTVLILPTIMKGYGAEIIISEMSATLLPIIIFFIAKNMSEKQAIRFETIFWGVCFLLLVTGIYYNATLNDPYYIRFLQTNFNGFAMWWFTKTPRLCSFYGAVVCGTFGCVCMCLSFRRSSTLNKYSFWVRYFTGFFLAVLSLQRSAMLCAFVFTVFSFYHLRRKKVISRNAIVGFIVLSLLVVLISVKYFPDTIAALFSRYNAFDTAISERSEGWQNAFNNGFFETLFGSGFGTGGQRAIGVSSATVNDGNYFKMIYDIGITGLVLFVVLSIKALKVGFREKRDIYSIVLLSYFVQMIGSNILTFGSTALLYWYAMGRIYAYKTAEE